jgi:hypothetical protein
MFTHIPDSEITSQIEIFQFGKLVLIIGEYVFSELREGGKIDQFKLGLLV